MILRVLFALCSLVVLAALLYQQDTDSGGGESALGEIPATEAGFAAVHAHLVQTGDDGLALYRLDAERIEQPRPQGTVYLTQPKLDYQPEPGNHWTLTALQGEMPEDASTADLAGDVHAEGVPGGSDAVMHIDTDQLHLDMRQQVATSASTVRVDWGGNRLDGRGMHADLKNDTLLLASKVHGVLLH